MVRLGDIIRQIRGVSYSPEDIRAERDENAVALLRANNIRDGALNFEDLIFVDKSRVSAGQYLRKGDILICSSSGSRELVGKAAYVPEDIPAAFGAFCKVARPLRGNARYIGYFFQSASYRRRVFESAAGANINNIRNEHIDNLEMPFPPEETQAYAADVLDKIQGLLASRKRQLAKLDELVKARFAEMFGDPVTNTQKRKVCPFQEFMRDIRYGTSQPPAFSEEGAYKFIRATNIKAGRITEKGMQRITEEEASKIEKCKLNGNEIIIVRSGVNTGDSCIVTDEYKGQYAGYDIIITLNLEIANPVFFNELINTHYMQDVIKPLTARSAQPHINSAQVRNLPMLVSSFAEQERFAAFVRQIEQAKSAVQRGADKLETLKAASIRKYFG